MGQCSEQIPSLAEVLCYTICSGSVWHLYIVPPRKESRGGWRALPPPCHPPAVRQLHNVVADMLLRYAGRGGRV